MTGRSGDVTWTARPPVRKLPSMEERTNRVALQPLVRHRRSRRLTNLFPGPIYVPVTRAQASVPDLNVGLRS